jgi:hypothetical protein
MLTIKSWSSTITIGSLLNVVTALSRPTESTASNVILDPTLLAIAVIRIAVLSRHLASSAPQLAAAAAELATTLA